MSSSSTPVRAMAALIASAGAAGPALAQVTWQASISDAYQHQRWGDETVTTDTGDEVADPGADIAWERGLDGTGNFGWCFWAATYNQLYKFEKGGGYDTIPGSPTDAETFHNGLKSWRNDWLLAPAMRAGEKLNRVMKDRAVGQDKGIKGLVWQQFTQDGANITFENAAGVEVDLGAGTIFEQAQKVIGVGDTASIRITGSKTRLRWWGGDNLDLATSGLFHQMTVAGYDDANRLLYLSDPDSNPTGASADGNRNADAGWKLGNDEWDEPPADNPTKMRRFANADPIPSPGATPPAAADITKRYNQTKLDAGKTKIDGNPGATKRFDGSEIRQMHTLETIKGAVKPAGAPGGPPPGTAKPGAFQVSPNNPGTSIDEFWIFPIGAEFSDPFTNEFYLDGNPTPLDDWSVVDAWTAGEFDDSFGIERPFGGIHVQADTLFALNDFMVLNMTYETTNPFEEFLAWDFYYMSGEDLTSLGVQVIGGGWDAQVNQVPAPGALGVIGAGVLASSRRRRR